MTQKEKLYKFAEAYFNMRWECVPVYLYKDSNGKKQAKFPGRWKQTVYDLGDFKSGYIKLKCDNCEPNSIAVKTGPSHITVLDRDVVPNYDMNEFIIKTFCGKSELIYDQTQSGGNHYYFQYNDKCHKLTGKEVKIDVLTGDSIIYVPPSRVEGGGEYKWIKPPKGDWRTLPVLPDRLWQFLHDKPPVAHSTPKKEYTLNKERDMELLQKISRHNPRPDCMTWVRLTYSVCDRFGEIEGKEIMKKFWPEWENGEYDKIKINNVSKKCTWGSIIHHAKELNLIRKK